MIVLRTDKKVVPPRWGDDQLSQFIENALQNTYATFHNLKPLYNRLKEIHVAFDNIVHNIDRTPDWFVAFFLFRSHSAFLGGVRFVLSGQIPEAYMVLRGCLENALYGLYLRGNDSRQETWLRQHDDEASKVNMRKEFTMGNLKSCLKTQDVKLHKIFGELYERTIDLGGHPNERAFFSVMKQQGNEVKTTFDSGYLIGDELALRLGLKSCAQIGVCALLIFQRIYQERFNILGLSEKLNSLKEGL